MYAPIKGTLLLTCSLWVWCYIYTIYFCTLIWQFSWRQIYYCCIIQTRQQFWNTIKLKIIGSISIRINKGFIRFLFICSSKLTVLKNGAFGTSCFSCWKFSSEMLTWLERNLFTAYLASPFSSNGSCSKSSFSGLLKLIYISEDGSSDLRLRFHLQSWLVTVDLFSWILQHASSLKSKTAIWLLSEPKLKKQNDLIMINCGYDFCNLGFFR